HHAGPEHDQSPRNKRLSKGRLRCGPASGYRWRLSGHVSRGGPALLEQQRLQRDQQDGCQCRHRFAPVSNFADDMAYAGGPVSEQLSDRRVKKWADKMATYLYGPALENLPKTRPVDLMPGVFVQYNDFPFGITYDNTKSPPSPMPEACHKDEDHRGASQHYNLSEGQDWADMLQMGLDHRRVAVQTTTHSDCSTPTVTTNTDYTSIVWIYSFNEGGERSGLDPLESGTPPYPYGFATGPLTTLRDKLQASAAITSAPSAPTPADPRQDSLVEGLRPTFSWYGVLFASGY